MSDESFAAEAARGFKPHQIGEPRLTECPHIDPDYADIGLLRAGASLEDHEKRCMGITYCDCGESVMDSEFRCVECGKERL